MGAGGHCLLQKPDAIHQLLSGALLLVWSGSHGVVALWVPVGGRRCPFAEALSSGSVLGFWTAFRRGSDRFVKECWYFAWSERFANVFSVIWESSLGFGGCVVLVLVLFLFCEPLGLLAWVDWGQNYVLNTDRCCFCEETGGTKSSLQEPSTLGAVNCICWELQQASFSAGSEKAWKNSKYVSRDSTFLSLLGWGSYREEQCKTRSG